MKKITCKHIILGAAVLTVLAIGLLTGTKSGFRTTADPLQKSIAKKVLRFHVLANSDDNKDQILKKEVRDVIGSYLGPKLSNARSMDQTKEVVRSEMEHITSIAQQKVYEEGYDYPVSAALTHTEFPVKPYGDYTFPAGEYEALEVTIGAGEGHNWWCVLYPNMCFRGSVYEEVNEDAKTQLREVLSPEEYEDVIDSGQFRVRFRFLEWFR